MLASGWAIVLLLGVACARLDPSAQPVAGPSASPPATSRGGHVPFVPKTEVRNGRAYLHVTFPDGSEGDFSYPAELNLAGLRVQPDVALTWQGEYIGGVVFSFGGPNQEILQASHPSRTFQTLDGWNAAVWEVWDRYDPSAIRHVDQWLVIDLPKWTVHVPVPGSVQPEALSEAVRPRGDSEGFVAVRVLPPAGLPQGWGESGGPGIQLGDSHPLESVIHPQDGRYLILAPSPGCKDEKVHSVSDWFGATCLAEGSVYFSVEMFPPAGANKEMVERIIENVRFENFSSPS